MSTAAPDASRVTPEGWAFSRPVRMVGDPFRVIENPPGAVWQAAVCADGKMRPVLMPRDTAAARPPRLLSPTPAPAGDPALKVSGYGSTFVGRASERKRPRRRGGKRRRGRRTGGR